MKTLLTIILTAIVSFSYSQFLQQSYIPTKGDHLKWKKIDNVYYESGDPSQHNQWIFFIDDEDGTNMYAFIGEVTEVSIDRLMRYAYKNFPNGFHTEDSYLPSYYDNTKAEDIYTAVMLKKGMIQYIYRSEEKGFHFGWQVTNEANIILFGIY
jgi:hypothetical protein